MKPLERDIQAALADWLRWHGWLVERRNVGMIPVAGKGGAFRKSHERGDADLLCIRAGRVVKVEVKRPGGKLSPAQRERREAWDCHGGDWVTATCIEDLGKAGMG
jgi:hypothetical protein